MPQTARKQRTDQLLNLPPVGVREIMKTQEENNQEKTDKGNTKHWKSLEEWRQDPEYQKIVENEFLVSPLSSTGNSAVARRDFLKLMGASIALSSAACIRRPVQKIIPYVNKPKEITHGVANYYTSTFLDGGESFGVLVKTREGRPIKLEGIVDHPVNRGGLTARAQAHVLSLYDPDRLQAPKKNIHNEKRSNRDTVSISWDQVDQLVSGKLKDGKVAVLTSTLASPSTDELIARFCTAFGGQRYLWDSLGAGDVLAANQISYGKAVLPRYDFSNANLVVSIGADFLGTYLSPAEFTKQWAANRNPNEKMNRLVAFESMMSLTGANADERILIRPSQQLDVVTALIKEIATTHEPRYSEAAKKLAISSEFNKEQYGIDALASELWEKRGRSLVIAGGINTRTERAVDLQIAVNFLNSILGNDGKTIQYDNSPSLTLQGSDSDLAGLVEEMNAGKIGTLLLYKVNPAYFSSVELQFTEALKKVKLVIYAGDLDETGLLSDLVLPTHHELENWGDAEFQSGVFSIQQPTIRPLYDSRSFQEMLMNWMKAAGKSAGAETWYEYVRSYWERKILGSVSFDEKWDKALQDGFVAKGAAHGKTSQGRSFQNAALGRVRNDIAKVEKELVIYQKIGIGDGRYANLSWLQELPDPVTKIVWDNYVNMSLRSAESMKMQEGDVVELSVGETVITAPVHIHPGVHDDVFAIAVGYGRWASGKVANGVGVHAFSLARFKEGQFVFSGQSVKIKKTGKRHTIANTGGHHSMMGRPIAAETTLSQFVKNPESGHFKAHFQGSIWDDHQYTGHKWGMVIDTNTCTGCSACVTACQAENNIPVVGKKYVLKGREMHWLRIDRYYSDHPSAPETLHQVMICQHCDNAPCETVCPVVATTHSDEGLNEMTYNRCVGTRYCANNCPYKVRRFNWFSYLEYREPTQMVLNPEVTVRSRGVMEKCSFCVHRIKEAKNTARDESRELKDGEIKTACEQSCPANAIVFGDVNDPKSRVVAWMKEKRAYSVLEELNTKPAVRYLTKIRNRTDKSEEHHS